MPLVAGVIYSWSYSGSGATIIGVTNSVLVNFSGTTTSGKLSVSASKICGTSIPRTIPIALYNKNKLAVIDGSFTTINDSLAISSTYELSVYPNQFTDKLNIEFRNQTDTHVLLKIYDITCKKLETLFDNQIKGGILYKSEYVPKMLFTNMVLYRMTIGEEILRGKIVYQYRK